MGHPAGDRDPAAVFARAYQQAVVLLPGGGATAPCCRAVAGGLAAADLASWLDQILDSLAVPRAALIGHSYGAWMALRYALHAPGRVSRLVLPAGPHPGDRPVLRRRAPSP